MSLIRPYIPEHRKTRIRTPRYKGIHDVPEDVSSIFIYNLLIDWNPHMTDERYGKCDVCRYCVHSDEDWACMINNKVVSAKQSCPRYRPGCCENCSHATIEFGNAVCGITKQPTDILNVCDKYDPCGRLSLNDQ